MDKCGKLKDHDEIATIRTGSTPGELRGLHMAMRQTGACGVPQNNCDVCHDDLKGVVVHISIPAIGGI